MKEMSITYSTCVFVALFVRHTKGKCRIYCHLWPVRLYDVFPHYLINGTILGKTPLNINLCFDVLNNFCLKYFSL
jgi:hypothetical protein